MHRIEYFFVKLLFFIFSNLSVPAGKRAAGIIFLLLSRVFRYREKVIRENLNRVYGQHWPKPEGQMIGDIYRNFVYLWMEFLQSDRLKADTIEKYFTFHDLHLLSEALQQGRGVILMSGHIGNFEWLGQALALQGFPIVAIAKKQSNPHVDAFITRKRQQNGARITYIKTAMADCLKALQDKEIVALVTDQDARKKGVFVDFLGVASSTAVGPAVFHLRTGAPILFVVAIRRDYGRFDVFLEKVEDGPAQDISDERIIDITQRHTRILDKWIRRHPEQWFWMHRRWKTQPPAEKAVRATKEF